jgi:hypothetical protein
VRRYEERKQTSTVLTRTAETIFDSLKLNSWIPACLWALQPDYFSCFHIDTRLATAATLFR